MIFIWIRKKVAQLLLNPLTSSSSSIGVVQGDGTGVQDSVSGSIAPCNDIVAASTSTASSDAVVTQSATAVVNALDAVSGISY